MKKIEKLFLLNPNVEIPKFLIKKMAGIDDWTRTIRKLRTEKGINIQPITNSNKNTGYIYKTN